MELMTQMRAAGQLLTEQSLQTASNMMARALALKSRRKCPSLLAKSVWWVTSCLHELSMACACCGPGYGTSRHTKRLQHAAKLPGS